MRLSVSPASGRLSQTTNTAARASCRGRGHARGHARDPVDGAARRPSPARCSATSPTRAARRFPARPSPPIETQTNISRTAVTNEAGNYIFSSLKNGTYSVEAELQGFRKVIRQNVRVDVNTTMRVDLTLELGQLTEAVTVAAETPLLQTDRTDTGRLLESKIVTEIPLGFNRNFQGLLVTVPGATRPFRPHSQFFNSQDSLSTEVNGQPRMANNTLIEGLDNNQKTGLLQRHHPGRRRARDRQRLDQQLRRGVRPIRRRDHQRDAEVGHQRPSRAAGSSSATPSRPTPATTSRT